MPLNISICNAVAALPFPFQTACAAFVASLLGRLRMLANNIYRCSNYIYICIYTLCDGKASD